MTTLTHTLNIFRAELGVKENPPGSNHQKYGAWYGWSGVPWCAQYVSWGLAQAGLGAQYRFAAVASSVAHAKRNGRLMSQPQVGAVCCKLYTATQGHTGIVEAVHPDGSITSIEGNTSAASDANGGMVMRRRRHGSFWNAGFYRIDYSDDTTQPVGPIHGADISHHQGALAVAAIRDSGVRYLWHKATEGGSFVDPWYRAKRQQATMVGLPFGAYDFVRPNVDPIRHARHFYAVAEFHIPGMLRPAMDLEVPGITPAWLRAYRDEVERLFGVVPCAYVATSIYQQPGIPEALSGCPLWVPRYSTQPPVIPWDVWQHTDQRPPFGIDGNVTYRLERVLLGATQEEDDVTPADRALLDRLHHIHGYHPGLAAGAVGMAATPSGNGYWIAMADGGVANRGDAEFFGSAAGMGLQSPVIGIVATPTGKGYWLIQADGGPVTFGDAHFYGSAANAPSPVP